MLKSRLHSSQGLGSADLLSAVLNSASHQLLSPLHRCRKSMEASQPLQDC